MKTTMSALRSSLIASALLLATSCVYTACDDDSAVKEPAPDAGTTAPPPPPAGQDGGKGQEDCVRNPTTHLEIINACTEATKIAKNPTLPKLLPDGRLPPLN